jgi:UPF0716 protein FxsA
MMWLIVAFVTIPLIEIALFIQVGGLIGLWPTLGIVLLTAVAGSVLLRSQGLATMNRLRASLDSLDDPSEPLAHGAMILFGGALLLTPGFFTDVVGIALMVPAVRVAVFRWIRARMTIVTPRAAAAMPETIDGTFDEVDPDRPDDPSPTHRPSRGPSGWTRH